MRITILTIVPETLAGLTATPIIARAIERNQIAIEIMDMRDYVKGSFRDVDDSPYGGGAGMILRCEPVLNALNACWKENSHVVCLTPVGRIYRQEDARRLCEKEHLILIAGHFEGFDARVYEHCDEMISVGDYILSSGEIPAMAIVDSIVRLLPGVIRQQSTDEESFENGLLEYPQYTRPRDYNGQTVPEVLLSGDHEAIRRYRLKESLLLTEKYRPDLFEKHSLSEEEKELLEEDK